MPAMSKREGQEFLRVFSNIQDEKIRYFFMMLGETIGGSNLAITQPVDQPRANTGPTHIEDRQQRLNAG